MWQGKSKRGALGHLIRGFIDMTNGQSGASVPCVETGMSRPSRAAAEVGVLRDRSRTKPATPCLLEPLTPARMASFSSPVNLFGTPRGRPGPGRSLVNEPLFAFLCLFLRLTGLGTLVTGPSKSRGMFVHYLVPLMGLLGLKGAPASSKT